VLAKSENLTNAGLAVADSVGATGFKAGWDFVMDEHERVKLASGATDTTLETIAHGTAGAALGTIAGVETFVAPNSLRELSDYSKFLKSPRKLVVSAMLDIATWAGAAGAEILTNQIGVAVATKIALNAATSFAVRTTDSIQRRRHGSA
jgi:hypothetical protein